MSTFDNAPPPADWHPDPRACPLPACDVCTRHEVDGYGVYPLPEHLVVGEN